MRASLAALGLLALLLSLAPPAVQCDDGPFSLADGGSLVVLDENHMEVPQNNDACATQPCGLAAICTPTGPDTRACSCPDKSGLILRRLAKTKSAAEMCDQPP
ncbi:hypothetical protein HYH03_013317 [Edaphochlamys debaryana]|uniref:Uncharacterized protein n=1 Tax=Edaphochlamys debaryana TaxID=47281 RepID=A0A835XR82_9CHLO|nr:hypothetical protein HYH03_013317 [Edaphochlamys debaryana]|eukprot:KAG2488175.1 hypothetical protein HYH03_013317 [Edaphochlamys debaryana]